MTECARSPAATEVAGRGLLGCLMGELKAHHASAHGLCGCGEGAVRRDDLVSQTSSHQGLRVRRSREAQPHARETRAARIIVQTCEGATISQRNRG